MDKTVSKQQQNEVLKSYRGKIAPWWYAIVAVLLVLTVLCAAQSGTAFIAANTGQGILMLVMTLVFLVFDVFLIDTCVRNRIDLYSDHLRVVFSFLQDDIDYQKINLVKESNNVLASPSASLDQLWIKYGYNEAKIAVNDKEAFIADLLEKNPQIKIEYKKKRVASEQS